MLRVLFVFTLALVLSCSSKDEETPQNQSAPAPTGSTPSPVNPSALSCTLALPNNGAAINSGTSVPLTVTAAGGTAPYATAGITGTFPSTATISKTYTNSGSTNQVVTETVSISDAAGATASCSVVVTVLPVSGPGSSLRCSIALNPSVIRTGAVAELNGTATGGKAPYQFLSFDMGGATVTEPMTVVSGSQVRTKGTYATTGLKTATLTVKDADMNQFACYISFTVLSPATVSLSAAPSTTVETGQTVTLTAAAFGFTAQPTLVFSTTEPNITITNAGGGAYVKSTDKAVHSFDVKVVATSANESAEGTIHLNFTAFVPLQCTLTRTGTLKTGEDIVFTITANNGETVQLTDFSQGAGGSVSSYTSNSATVKYYSSGSKTVLAKAQSTTSYKECQDGAGVSQTFTIANALSCTVSLGSSYVPAWSYTTATANIPANAPFAPFYLVDISSVPYANAYYYGAYGNTGAWLIFTAPGSYLLTLKVQDTYGNQASCSAVQSVY